MSLEAAAHIGLGQDDGFAEEGAALGTADIEGIGQTAKISQGQVIFGCAQAIAHTGTVDEKGIMDICERFPDIELVNIYVAAKPETLKARGIAPERMKRDEYRVTMDINSFDYVITNNSSLYRLLTTTLNVVRCIQPSNGEPSKKLAAEAEEKLKKGGVAAENMIRVLSAFY